MPKTAKRTPETDHSDQTAERASTGGAMLLANWNYSLADFYSRRIQKYWQYPFELSEMRSLADVAHSLVEFETELLADYSDQVDEFQRIVDGEGRQAQRTRGQKYEARLLKAQKDAALIIDQAKAQAQRIIHSAELRAEKTMSEDEVAPHTERKRAHG